MMAKMFVTVDLRCYVIRLYGRSSSDSWKLQGKFEPTTFRLSKYLLNRAAKFNVKIPHDKTVTGIKFENKIKSFVAG